MTARLSLLLAMLNRPADPDPAAAACEVCGCTEDRACPGGCYWVPGVPADLCSTCAALLRATPQLMATAT